MADEPVELRETERRVLGNLPVYRTAAGHKAARKQALEAGTIATGGEWPTDRTLADLTARLAADRHCVIDAGDEERVAGILGDLADDGLVVADGDRWAMTEAGLEALVA